MIITQKNIKLKLHIANYKLPICSLFITLLISSFTFGQDLHFTQYNNAPLLVNPANTGFSHFYDYRLGINNRTQWAGTNTPYKTFSVWGDAQLFRNKFQDSWIGIGGILLNDVAGTGNLKSLKSYLNIAYHQNVSDNGILSVGGGVGIVQKRIDPDKLIFDDQWNGKFFDAANIQTKDIITSPSTSYLDINIGINYSVYASDKFYFNCGISMMHLNTPEETFFNNSLNSPKINARYNGFINTTFKINDVLILSPTLNYSQQGNMDQFVLGVNGQYNLTGNGNTQLLFGGYYRYNDAIAPAVGFMLSDFQVLFNYDITTSSLKAFNAYQNTYEVSLQYNGLYDVINKDERALKCKALKF